MRGLEPSYSSWKDRNLKRDLQMTLPCLLSGTHLNSLGNDLLNSPPKQPRLSARLRRGRSLKCKSSFKRWIRKLDKPFSFNGCLSWQDDALTEMSPPLEIVSSAAERLFYWVKHQPCSLSHPPPPFPCTHAWAHTYNLFSTHRESQWAFYSLWGFDFTSYKHYIYVRVHTTIIV